MTVPATDGRLQAMPRALRVRELVTPEGTPLVLGVARAGDRLTAFLFDVLVMLLLTLSIVIPALLLAALGAGADFLPALSLLAVVTVRLFYFPWHELRRQGVTPGKRKLNLRVIDAAGGHLTTEAVLVRNFMREVECWLPLQVLAATDLWFPGAPGWTRLLAVLWFLLIACVPLFNADRRRAGDLLAGTMVVLMPRAELLQDLGSGKRAQQGVGVVPAPSDFTFTRSQLDVYGVFELETLEEVLRRKGRDRRKALRAVSDRIRKRIGWKASQPVDPEAFLRAFYRAQRRHLEQKMLLGERRERQRRKDHRAPRRRR